MKCELESEPPPLRDVTEGVILIFIRKFLVPNGYTPRLTSVGQARPSA